jgi:hypothetical protein
MQAVGFKRFPVWSLVGGYVVARRRSSACLLTAHALVAIGAMAVAAGTFDWLASNDHARTGTKKSLIESLGQAAGSDPRGERATRVGGSRDGARQAPAAGSSCRLKTYRQFDAAACPAKRKSQAQRVICSPCAEPLELTAPAASADATRPDPLLLDDSRSRFEGAAGYPLSLASILPILANSVAVEEDLHNDDPKDDGAVQAGRSKP